MNLWSSKLHFSNNFIPLTLLAISLHVALAMRDFSKSGHLAFMPCYLEAQCNKMGHSLLIVTYYNRVHIGNVMKHTVFMVIIYNLVFQGSVLCRVEIIAVYEGHILQVAIKEKLICSSVRTVCRARHELTTKLPSAGLCRRKWYMG